jgi:His-Xaa-Ser system radical SAM maturase HxsC
MRRVVASFSSDVAEGVRRVVLADHLQGEWVPDLRFLVHVRSESDRTSAQRLVAGGTDNVGWVVGDGLRDGDVVAPLPGKGQVVVLFRESDEHHSLLMTNRCNSYCLMCSQPPTPQDDSWLVEEAFDAIRHLRLPPRTLGLSGGEPLLLGAQLRRVLDCIATTHPTTAVEVLTNGRRLSDPALASLLLNSSSRNISWLVPLYGHADFVHDFVVQAPGAFDETLGGLLALQEHGQQIQLRVVLIKPVLETLTELCGFIGRNLPFVREVALMACEPIGFAMANREHCEVDLADWTETLQAATQVLKRHRVQFLFMNMPLCSLPRNLWGYAHKSISDWKNVYDSECSACAVRDQCSGLFAWHERAWKPTTIRAFIEVPA